MTLSEEYVNLLITQYYDSPRAEAEITAKVERWEALFNSIREVSYLFDIDEAYGDILDKIGIIEGISRVVPLVIPRVAFGFDGNENSRGFGDPSISGESSAPFQDALSPAYNDKTLQDNEYRALIKVKAALNNGSAFMVSDEFISMQEVIVQAFSGEAFVVDNKDMTLTLYISTNLEQDVLNLVKALDLLPKPLGVKYRNTIEIDFSGSFGFSDNPNSLGFADATDSNIEGGIFANKVA